SYLIERLGPGGASAGLLESRLDREKDPSTRAGLILALGGFDPDRQPRATREWLLGRLEQLYRDDPDPGGPGAADWLLREWHAADRADRADRELESRRPRGARQWYVNSQGQTLTAVPAPKPFTMGEGAKRHDEQIDHPFAIATKEVTVEQF